MSDASKWIIGLMVSILLAAAGGYISGNEKSHSRFERRLDKLEREVVELQANDRIVTGTDIQSKLRTTKQRSITP
jgi:hypothetical protein